MLLNLLFLSAFSFAQSPSVTGFWRTFDDVTGLEKSVVEIKEQDGELVGTIQKLSPKPDRPPNPVCEKCSGEFKDQPILGLRFLWGLKPAEDKEDKKNQWKNGKILDPNNGKIYSSKIKMLDNGQKLEVRGFIGISMFGRTQTWLRTEKP